MTNQTTMTKWLRNTCLVAAIAMSALGAMAEEVVIRPSEGVILASGSHADRVFSAGKYETLFVGSSGSGVAYKILLRFDVMALASRSQPIERITLTLHDKTDDKQQADHLLGVFAVNDANIGWTEAAATWNHQDQTQKLAWAGLSGLGEPGVDYQEPALATAFELANTPEGEMETIEFDLTAFKDTLFQQWLEGKNAGLLIMRLEPITQAETSANGRSQIASHRFTNEASARPTLTVTYAAPDRAESQK